MRQGLSGSGFYGDLVYKLKKIVDYNNFSAQFVVVVSHYRVIGCGINVFQQADCLGVNPFTVGNFCLFDLILHVPSTLFQINRNGSSWVESVLSYDNAVTLVRLETAAPRS